MVRWDGEVSGERVIWRVKWGSGKGSLKGEGNLEILEWVCGEVGKGWSWWG